MRVQVEVVPLSEDEVHVWRASLDLPRGELEALSRVLSPQERSRAERFVDTVHRRRFVAAHGWLRSILGRYLGRPPAVVQITGDSGTKPAVAGPPDLRFSLSHSADVALVAVVLARDVGIDVEALRPVENVDALAAACFSGAELEAWRDVPGPARSRAFFETWTRKEAFLKAVGQGLSRPLTSFDVTVGPAQPPQLLRVDGDASAPARFELHSLSHGPALVGTLAVDGRGLRLSSRAMVPRDPDENS